MFSVTISVTYNMRIKEIKRGKSLHTIYTILKSKKDGNRFFVTLAYVPEHLLHQVELVGLKKRNCLTHYSLKDDRTLRVQIIPLRPINKKLDIFISFPLRSKHT